MKAKKQKSTWTCLCGAVFKKLPQELPADSELLEMGDLEGQHKPGCPNDHGVQMHYLVSKEDA